MITDRERRLLRVVEATQSQLDRAMIDRALDRLEAEIRTKDASGHEHVGKGSPEGGQFGKGGGGSGGSESEKGSGEESDKTHGRKPRAPHKPGEVIKPKPSGSLAQISEKQAAKYGLTVSEAMDRIKKGKPLKLTSEKAIRAQKHQSKTDGEVQAYTKENEFKFAKRVNGKAFPDNDPADVHLEIKGKTRGIELKTMVRNTNDKITMKGEALARKDQWENQNKHQMDVVALDHRDKFAPELHSGHEIYYKRGTGSFRVGSMYRCKDEGELMELMATPYDKLPKAAQGPIRGWKDDKRVARPRA